METLHYLLSFFFLMFTYLFGCAKSSLLLVGYLVAAYKLLRWGM